MFRGHDERLETLVKVPFSLSMLEKAMKKLHRDVAGGRSLISIGGELNWQGTSSRRVDDVDGEWRLS